MPLAFIILLDLHGKQAYHFIFLYRGGGWGLESLSVFPKDIQSLGGMPRPSAALLPPSPVLFSLTQLLFKTLWISLRHHQYSIISFKCAFIKYLKLWSWSFVLWVVFLVACLTKAALIFKPVRQIFFVRAWFHFFKPRNCVPGVSGGILRNKLQK